MKRGKLIRYIGIVCWFLALLFLFQSGQAKKAEQAAQETTVIEETQPESGGTVLYPTE